MIMIQTIKAHQGPEDSCAPTSLSITSDCNDVVDGQYANDDVNDSIPARPSMSMEKDVETQSTALDKVDSVIMDVSTASP